MFTRPLTPLLAAVTLSVGCLGEVRSGTANGAKPIPTSPASTQPKAGTEPLRVHFLDIGQGDAAWVQVPGGVNLLVDGGPSGAGPKVIAALKAGGVKRLDWVIGSHPHEDHIGGLVDVLREVPVSQALDPGYNHGTALQRNYLELLKSGGVKTTRARTGQVYPLGSDCRLEILAPRDPLVTSGKADANNNSIVMRLVHGQTRFLFTGDLESAGRDRLMKETRADQLKSQVLKVAHHGSHNGTDPAFLKAVAPEYAVISSGKGNDYGHPHRETLDELASSRVKVLRTDESGTLVCESDGKTIRWVVDPNRGKSGAPVTATTSSKGEVIGHRSSKIYHSPDCSALPAPQNRVKLSDAVLAEREGYRPHRACLGNR